VFILSVSVVPAIVEEIALRAGVLQAMRKYGDWFAIFTSAFIFAVLHGNMIQTPFAFIAGIGLGYVFCATGSIWPGIIIHFINNFTSCISTMGPIFGLPDGSEADKAGVITMDDIYMAFFSLVLIAGVVCFVLYLIDKKRPVLNKDNSTLTLSQKIGGFLFNIPMIISLIYMGYNTAQYIK
jgi:membrane protease YdiL (CAAX protease family)